uniref:Uncharacterized protein n=1 Tax=Rhizobium leguminosarum bv. viciae TaxID=387 RepID=A0A0U3JAD1_RHILV|nr:hypothetical protein [Rhizobium leguminosarum bv. viciae]
MICSAGIEQPPLLQQSFTLNEPSHLADNAFQDVAHHAVCRFACGASLINRPEALGVRKARS